MKWEHRIKSIDNKTKVTFSFDIDEKKWKKVELESLQRILNTNFKNDKGKYIYFFMPIVESFYSLKENREYLFYIKSSDKPDLLIESEFGVIGVEFTTSSSTERKKGGTETRRMPDIQKKQLKELLKDKDSFSTDSVPHKYIKNDHENLMQAMIKRIEEKSEKSYNIDNLILLVELIEEFFMVVYGPDKSGCYQQLEGEKLNDYFCTLRIKEVAKSLENIEIKNFKNLVIFVTPSRLFPSCFNFKIVNNKVDEIKNIFKKEKENFEKKWNCKFDDIKNQYIPLYSILAGSKI